MFFKKLIFLSLVSFLAILCTGALAQENGGVKVLRQRNTPTILNKQIQHIRIVNQSVSDCLILLGNRIGFVYALEDIPCGNISVNDLQKPVSLDLHNVSLQEVFDKLIVLNPSFAWRIEDNGLIRFLPSAKENSGYLPLQVIPQYTAKGVDIDAALSILGKDIYKTHQYLELEPPMMRFGGAEQDTLGDSILVNIARQDITVRDILDLLSAKSGGSWILSYNSSFKYYTAAIGNRIAAPLQMVNAQKTQMNEVPLEPNDATILECNAASPPPLFRSPYGTMFPVEFWDGKTHQVSISNATLPECVMLLGNHYHLQYSVEDIPSGKITQKELLKLVSLDLKNVSLFDIFNALTNANNVYTYAIKNNMVHFYPRTSENSRTYLLTEIIPEYQVSGALLPNAIDELITDVTRLSPDSHLVNGIKNSRYDAEDDAILINYTRQNITARDVLSDISFKLSESWVVLQKSNDTPLTILMSKHFSPNAQTVSHFKISDNN